MTVTALAYCIECDGPLRLRATGPGSRFEKRAVLDCMCCGLEHVFVARLDATEQTRVARCGTTGGYAAHRRKGEEPCDDCSHAHSIAQNARRRARKVAA